VNLSRFTKEHYFLQRGKGQKHCVDAALHAIESAAGMPTKFPFAPCQMMNQRMGIGHVRHAAQDE
jgi:hypothetical protein